ncbi:divergent polysaccharide deacetylase family protein [Sagittula sp. S175]|uniref:divergent polysaccharide deacetylase family protein n=1 Tax=Sagittula sp. S175 TaxID=3415129 RepID=UPI003C7C721C
MARGFLAGVIWGAVVSGVGIGALSVATGLPEPAPAPEADVSAPAVAIPEVVESEPPVAVIDDAAPDVVAVVPEVTEPVQDTPASAGDPMDAPLVGESPQALAGSDPVDADVAVSLSPETPVQLNEPDATPEAPDPEQEPQIVEDSAPEPVEMTEAMPEPAPETAPEPEPAPETPAVASIMEQQTDERRFGTPAGSLVDRNPAVEQNRLPTIGAAATPETVTAAPTATLSPDSPLMRYSTAVTPPADVPRMALVLIDDGSAPMGPAELETLPFPVTFAIAPGHPYAAGVAQGYRDRGFEVLALADVPEGATASDVEVTMAGLLSAVPGAVGVLEDPTGPGLQSSREVASQAAAYLGASGHGLVMEPNGLNTAQKLAAKEGVPSVTLFRDIDGEGQDESLIRRTLDQAAFRARQEGSVVMLGRIRAGTISALVLWGLQDRGNTITLVPISTVLKESTAPATE